MSTKVKPAKVETGGDKFPFPGLPQATDGTDAIVAMETAGSEAAGAYPITPATGMGEGWAAAVNDGRTNVHGRRLLFFEPEGEHAAAAVTAGLSMTGLRTANFTAGQGIAYMHESLYAAVGKRLTYVLNIACRAITKHSLNIHAGHDDYHAADDTGFFQLFAKNAQEAADFNLIAHRVAELSLTPGMCAQDGFLTSHVIETMKLPERELVKRYLGDPADMIDSPTPAQRMVFGEKRRRIPELMDVDNPAMLGVVQNQDSYAQGVAAQRPFFFDHIADLTDQAMKEFYELTGRRYARVAGYRVDDAEYVVMAQGSLVWNLEAVVDYLRDKKGLKLGVLNLSMFRPFPADLITKLLKGKKACTVLERVDQPLAVDQPMIRETRAAIGQALENGRAKNGKLPFPTLAVMKPEDAPDFFSGAYGLGSRDVQPGDMIAAVNNMTGEAGERKFYLGIDFIRRKTELPGLASLRDEISAAYPDVAATALERAENVNLMPESAISVRIHSVGGWGAITTGKNLAMTMFDLLGMHVKANPKYGSEKKGQPTTFYATLAHEQIRLNCDLSHVDVVMSPDPNVFRHSNPLAGLPDGGTFIIQHDGTAQELWDSLPPAAQRGIKDKKIRLLFIDGFKVAAEEAPDPELQYRMQGAAFQGAFFRGSPIMEREKLAEKELFEAIHKQLDKKFGHRGQKVVDSNLKVIRRGYDELEELDVSKLEASDAIAAFKLPKPPRSFVGREDASLIGDANRFFDQVASTYAIGQEPTADPFLAMSVIPAATTALRDMTGIRFEVPRFVAENCTGCGACWVQCPDSAIPGRVLEIEDILKTASRSINGEIGELEYLPANFARLAEETRAYLKDKPFKNFADTLRGGYRRLAPKLDLHPASLEVLDKEVDALVKVLVDFPLAKARPFFDLPESREEGSGGLLAVTVNPETCKGCNLCVDVCPDQALITVKQDNDEIARLRRNWLLWEQLPDTPDRFVNVRDMDQGIGILSTLLLKKSNYQCMTGGDGACMGCGEKTGMHLLISAVEASMQPRVADFVEKLEDLIERTEEKARLLLVAGVDLDAWPDDGQDRLDVEVSQDSQKRIRRVTGILKQLKDLRERYQRGRAACSICNSTGCSSVWASSFPYNPYPYPWVNHLFQDGPSIAIGVFEGHMRKMADNFGAVRRAELEIKDGYDAAVHEPFFEAFDYHQFTDEEFKLCPPVLAVGGDGAMFDIGFQNLSRLLASGKPIRVAVLDTQVYSNTGGQACTSGFTGQVSDMATFGKAHHGKTETRKELALIGIAHRGAYVLQASQAHPSHFVAGVLKGLNSRRPSLFILHTPCMPEHGISDDSAYRTSKMALEGRATPVLVYNPDAGRTMAECLDLDGNPAVDQLWPSYTLNYQEDGEEKSIELPMTTADWAAVERRFIKHFKRVKRSDWNDKMVPIADYLLMTEAQRQGKTPFIHMLEADRSLGRMMVSSEMVFLAEERLQYWSLLKQLSGDEVSELVHRRVADSMEEEFDHRVTALQGAHEAAMADLKRSYPDLVAARLSQVLINGGESTRASITAAPRKSVSAASQAAGAPAATAAVPAAEEFDGELPWIETALCTTCDECTKINPKMFKYNAEKKAYIADPKAGTFKELVMAAERCSAEIIHPGTPLNPKERELDKWTKRAEPYQ